MEPAMRYVKGHGLQTRSRIVENASYGLRQNGADGVSVADLMRLAGLSGRLYAVAPRRDDRAGSIANSTNQQE
jgi:hypothetical protein